MLQSMWLQRGGHDLATEQQQSITQKELCVNTVLHWVKLFPQRCEVTVLNPLYRVDMNLQINRCWVPAMRILSAIVESYREVQVGG